MKIMMALVFVALLPASAFAWWAPQAQFSINHNFAQATVYNPTPAIAFCQGYVFGQLQNGQVVNSWFSYYIPPFQSAYAQVSAYPPFFFVNAWADIRCQ